MGELCTRYWYPVYAFLRRRGCDADEAMDVTQGFFARLLQQDDTFGLGDWIRGGRDVFSGRLAHRTRQPLSPIHREVLLLESGGGMGGRS